MYFLVHPLLCLQLEENTGKATGYYFFVDLCKEPDFYLILSDRILPKPPKITK